MSDRSGMPETKSKAVKPRFESELGDDPRWRRKEMREGVEIKSST